MNRRSDAITRLLRAEHRPAASEIRDLTAEDVRELESIVAEREHEHRSRAMDALVWARGAGATRALSDVLADERERDTVRAAAASHLGRVGPTGEPALVAALNSDESTILMAAAGALVHTGSATALDALTPLAERDDLLGQQARFARTVIAFRTRTRGHEPPPAAAVQTLPVPGDERIPIVSRSPRTEEAGDALRALRAQGLMIPLNPDAATTLECGRERLIVAVHAPGDVLERAGVVATVARRAETDRTYSLKWLVLAWPQDGTSAEIGVFRPSGQQVLAGTATFDKEQASFELRAVEGRGNIPVELHGTARHDRIITLAGASARSRTGRGKPTPE